MRLTEDDRDALEESLPWANMIGHTIDTGPGWFDLIAELDEALREIYPDYTILQVKEKFGTLRYYTNGVPSELFEIFRARINEAETKSTTICEECGEPGTSTSYGWIRVLCDAHALEAEQRVALKKATQP
jgi:hypothetical protein